MIGQIITWLLIAAIIVALMVAVAKAMFQVAKKFAVVFEIILFVALVMCMVRVFCTKENLHRIKEEVDNSGIVGGMEGIINGKGKGATDQETQRQPADNPKPTSEGAKEPVKPSQPPVVTPEPVKPSQSPVVTPEPPKPSQPPVVTPEPVKPSQSPVVTPEPVKPAVDYSKYDKGSKEFSYALPFDAKVLVSFREGAYQLVVTSLGTLSDSDKPQFGELALKAISEYRGEEVKLTDNGAQKISVDVKYDANSNHTNVSMVIPVTAVNP